MLMRMSLLKSFLFLTAGNVLIPVASIALVVAISRLGGVEMLGQYSLLITFFSIGQTCSSAGKYAGAIFERVGARLSPRNKIC